MALQLSVTTESRRLVSLLALMAATHQPLPAAATEPPPEDMEVRPSACERIIVPEDLVGAMPPGSTFDVLPRGVPAPQGAPLTLEGVVIEGLQAVLITEVYRSAFEEGSASYVEVLNVGVESLVAASLQLDLDGHLITFTADAHAGILQPGCRAMLAWGPGVDDLPVPTGTPLVSTELIVDVWNDATEPPLILFQSGALAAEVPASVWAEAGVSMELVDPDVRHTEMGWRASSCLAAKTPGRRGCAGLPGVPEEIVITEARLHDPTCPTCGDWVELYNPTDWVIDLGGTLLDDGEDADLLVPFRGGTTAVQPGAFALVVDRDFAGVNFVPPRGTTLVTTLDDAIGSGLAVSGEVLTLRRASDLAALTFFNVPLDMTQSTAAIEGPPTPWSASGASLQPSCVPQGTPGRLNGVSGGVCAPLAFTELSLGSSAGGGGAFLEVYNPSTNSPPVDVEVMQLHIFGAPADLHRVAGSPMLLPGGWLLIVGPTYDGRYNTRPNTVVAQVDAWLPDVIDAEGDVVLTETLGVDGTWQSITVDALPPMTVPPGRSVERWWRGGQPSFAGWSTSVCTAGASPAAAPCDVVSPARTAGRIAIVEVMSNPIDESTGEFVELYNLTDRPLDLAGIWLDDTDSVDRLRAFGAGTTVIPPRGMAVVVDPQYGADGTDPYALLAGDRTLLTTSDQALGTGLAVDDRVRLLAPDGLTTIATYAWPLAAPDGVSAERIGPRAPDEVGSWRTSTCAGGHSAGRESCP